MLFGEHINDPDFIANIVALVLGVGNHIGHCGVGNLVAVMVAVALIPEDRLDLLHGVLSASIQLEQFPDHLCLLLIDGQPPAVFHIAEDTAVTQNHLVLDGLLMTKLDTAGKLAQLVLCDRGHNRQPELRIFVQGVDIVILKKHAYTAAEKLTGVLDGVQCVSCKTGNFLGDHKVKFVLCGILNHPVEILTFLGGNAGQTFINVTGNESPVTVALDQLVVIGYLIAQGIELLVALRRNTGVISHPQGNIVDGFHTQLLPNTMDVHTTPP